VGTRTAIVWLTVCLVGTGLNSRAGEPPQPGENLIFAETLFAERDFYRAITEYKRELFRSPDAPWASWIRFRIGQSYLEGGKLEAAWTVFSDLADRAADERLQTWAHLTRARIFYLQGRYQQAIGLLDKMDENDPVLAGTAAYLRGCSHLRTGEFVDAKRSFESMRAGHALSEKAGWLAAQMDRAEDLPEKSPVLAGLLSMVPGLGHVYLEEYAVGFTALIWNGLFGYATYDTFRRGHYGVGALLAALELLWYTGTIYGAVSGAHRYNRDARLNFLDDLEAGAGLDVPFPDPKAVGSILLRGEF
jgi:predicted negative regulator of RcsB-dependent stress response